MKKVLIAVAAVMVLAASGSAQIPNPISLYAGGAVSMPSSEAWSDMVKTGFHGSVGVGYKVMPNMQLVGKIEYHRFGLNDDALALMDAEGGHNNVWMYGADARYSFGLPAAPIKPYILGGVGFANISASDLEGTSDLVTSFNQFNNVSTTELYFNVGAGAELKAGPAFSLFGQVRYVSVQTDGEASAFIPLTVGVKFF